MGSVLVVANGRHRTYAPNLKKKHHQLNKLNSEPSGKNSGKNSTVLSCVKKRKETDFTKQKKNSTELLNSRRGYVNFLDATQSSVKDDVSTGEVQVAPFPRFISNVDTVTNSSKKKGSDEDSDRMAKVKSLNSILLKSIHSSGSMGSREGLHKASWAGVNHHSGQNDDTGRRVRSSFNDSGTLDRDCIFDRVQKIVSKMHIHRIEEEYDNLCSQSYEGEDKREKAHEVIPTEQLHYQPI